jgi:hypothetical protein
VTSNEHRATTLVRALRAAIDRDRQTLRELLIDDVRAWSPTLSTASLDELFNELDQRDEAFTDIELDVAPLDVGGDYACVEWTVEMTHSGTTVLADHVTVEASGIRVTPRARMARPGRRLLPQVPMTAPRCAATG